MNISNSSPTINIINSHLDILYSFAGNMYTWVGVKGISVAQRFWYLTLEHLDCMSHTLLLRGRKAN